MHTHISPSACNQMSSPCPQQTPQGSPMSPTSMRVPNTLTQRPSVITEQKPVTNCHDGSSANVQMQDNAMHYPMQETAGTTEQLRQHRRPVRGKLFYCFFGGLGLFLFCVFCSIINNRFFCFHNFSLLVFDSSLYVEFLI